MHRVLIVEDMESSMELLRELMERESDFEVVSTATNGTEAIVKFDELEPDVVLLDLVLPGKDGLEVARHIKATRPNTKIIVVSAVVEDSILAEAKDMGVDAYLTKPFTRRMLTDTLKKVVA